jgi:hypothetical protein
MTGIYDDNNAAGRQPPEVLAAWIQEQLADLQDTQVRRLAQLRSQLQSETFEWDSVALGQAVTTLNSSCREIHFEDLRLGWFARKMGKHKAPYARFVAAYERMVACAVRMKTVAAKLVVDHKTHSASAKRVLLELGIERKGLQEEVDQGVTWLQDMCVQLNALGEQGSTDPQLPRLAGAAQAFTQSFKALQSAASIAEELGVRGQSLLDRRAALLEQVRADSEFFEKSWVRAIGKVAGDVKAGRTSFPGIGDAVEAHDELVRRLGITSESCAALQHEEHLMAQHLDMLRKELEPRR